VLKQVTFTDGIVLSTSAKLLVLEDGSSVTGVSNNGHVSGPIRKIGNTAFIFPVGDGRDYAPIEISAPLLGTDHFTAEYFDVSPDANYSRGLLQGSLDHVSAEEYWILDRSNGTSSVNVTLSWEDTRSGGVDVLGELSVARWDGSEWADHSNGGTVGSALTGDVISSAPITSFSPFTLSSTTTNNPLETDNSPLPIQLVSFSAEVQNDQVDVSWVTASEINNDFFTVERSLSGYDWGVVTELEGAGNSTDLLAYHAVDEAPYTGVSYYRLKQTDFDGKYEYSELIAVEYNYQINVTGFVYPTIVKSGGEFYINLENEIGDDIQVEMTDVQGEKVFSQTGFNQESKRKIIVEIGALEQGMYIVTVKTIDNIFYQRIVIE